MKPLGKIVMRQEDVVVWHARIQQLLDAVSYMRDQPRDLDMEQVDDLFDEMIADLSSIKSKLPPIQTQLPL